MTLNWDKEGKIPWKLWTALQMCIVGDIILQISSSLKTDYFSVHSKNILALQLCKNIFFIWKPTQDRSNSALNRTRTHRTFRSIRNKLWIKQNQNAQNLPEPTEQTLNLTEPERTEPSGVHWANSELNGTRTHQEAPGSQHLRESTTHPSPSGLALTVGHRQCASLCSSVLAAWLLWPLLHRGGCWRRTALLYWLSA